ncbi:MAG TPA: DUF1772 domain-containing protein [Gemmatimonadales bacterium]|nr:DUF1772 domain-containing protein [Gemmatimonadales bacterium]
MVAGLLLGPVIPFTLVVVFPTNTQLLDPSLKPGSARTAALLTRWGRLHAVRSGVAVMALVVLLLHLGGML